MELQLTNILTNQHIRLDQQYSTGQLLFTIDIRERFDNEIKRRSDIDVLDMECSALFSAARKVGIKAIAVFYVTDILFEKHVLRQVPPEEQRTINDSIQKAQRSICAFLNQIT